MKGWVLYGRKHSQIADDDHGISRLLEEAAIKNMELTVYNPEQFELIVSRSDKKSILIDDKIHELPDFFIPRMGSATTYFALSVIRQIENLHIFSCNSAQSIEIVKDKLHVHQILAQSDLPTPKTMLLKLPININLVKKEIGFPLIIKNITGTGGKGVYLCESASKLEDLIQLLYSYNKSMNIIIQEFVSFRKGEDLRVFVVGGKVIGCMKRLAKKRGFKANYSTGGSVEAFELNSEIEELAVKTANLFKLEVTGIDLLFDESGYKVLEVNSSPGFKGLEKATGNNIAKEILSYIETEVHKIKSKKH